MLVWLIKFPEGVVQEPRICGSKAKYCDAVQHRNVDMHRCHEAAAAFALGRGKHFGTCEAPLAPGTYDAFHFQCCTRSQPSILSPGGPWIQLLPPTRTRSSPSWPRPARTSPFLFRCLSLGCTGRAQAFPTASCLLAFSFPPQSPDRDRKLRAAARARHQRSSYGLVRRAGWFFVINQEVIQQFFNLTTLHRYKPVIL